MGHPSPSKLFIPIGRAGPPANTWFVESTRAHNPKGISIGSAVYAQLTEKHPYTSQRADISPIKIAASHGKIWLQLIHDSNSPPEHKKQHLDRFSRFCIAHNCDRQTDHTARSVTIGHIYICSTAMQPKKVKEKYSSQTIDIQRSETTNVHVSPISGLSTEETKPNTTRMWANARLPNVLVALPNTGGALCSTPQSLADAHY